MIALLDASYPPDIFKAVTQAFTSPELPRRNAAVKELGSIGYQDESGGHALFLFDVPDAMIAEFITTQSRRSAYISARAPGFTIRVHMGQAVGEAIPLLLPMYP